MVTEDEVEWHRDPAASGWRSRAFLDRGELIAYDDGTWLVSLRGQAATSAIGREANGEKAKKRSFRVYNALVEVYS
jgi:hypothetical protein